MIRCFLCRLFGCKQSHGSLGFIVGPVIQQQHITMGGANIMALVLTDEQQVALAIEPKTAAGNPARVDGVPTWQSSDPAIVDLVVAADGLSAVAKTVGPLGNVQVSVTADADLGEGVRAITGTLDIEVKAAEAVTLGISAGTPEVKTS